MKTSTAGIDLIKEFEGLRLKAYPDPASGGAPWTIGYGTTSDAGVGAVSKGMEISQTQAESMLVLSLESYERGVLRALTRIPTQPQFDAMVSLAYNIGVAAFARSTVAREFNAGRMPEAAEAFLLWNKAAGKVMPGLVRRRQAERALFLKPAAVLPPQRNAAGSEEWPPAAINLSTSGQTIAKWVMGAAASLIAVFAAWMMKG